MKQQGRKCNDMKRDAKERQGEIKIIHQQLRMRMYKYNMFYGAEVNSNLPVGWISCPFFSHFTSTSGLATSTASFILCPFATWYAGSNFFRKAKFQSLYTYYKSATVCVHIIWIRSRRGLFLKNCALQPSLFFCSFFIFFSRFSMPLRSVMPCWKAIFSYSDAGAWQRMPHTSKSGSVLTCTALIHEKQTKMLKPVV